MRSLAVSLFLSSLLSRHGSANGIDRRGTVGECNLMNAPAPITAINDLITQLSQPSCTSKSFPASCSDTTCSIFIESADAYVNLYAHGTAVTVSCATVASLVSQGTKECGTSLNRTDTTFQIQSDDNTFDVLVSGNFPDPGFSCETLEEPAPVADINSLLAQLSEPNCSSKTAPVGTFGTFLDSATTNIEIIAIAGTAVPVTCAQASALITKGLSECTANDEATFYVESADKTFAVEVTGNLPPGPPITCNEMNGQAPISTLNSLVQTLEVPTCTSETVPAGSCHVYISAADATVYACSSATESFSLSCADVAALMREGIETCGAGRETTTFDIDSQDDGKDWDLLVVGPVFP